MLESQVFGVVCALPREARCLVRGARDGITAGFIRFVSGGVGYAAASAAARELLDQGVDSLLSFGYAGGLDPRLHNGSVVVADRITASGGDEVVLNPDLVSAIRRAIGCQPGDRPIVLAHAGSVLGNTAEKTVLFKETGAVAVDMESLAVAQVAQGAGVAAASVRVIVDPANFALPQAALEAVDVKGALRPWALLRALLKRPAEAPALWRLRSMSAAADAALERVAQALGQARPG